MGSSAINGNFEISYGRTHDGAQAPFIHIGGRDEALLFVTVYFEHASGRSDRTYETGWPGRTGDLRRPTSSTRMTRLPTLSSSGSLVADPQTSSDVA